MLEEVTLRKQGCTKYLWMVKVVCVGNGGVGKTCLLMSYTNNDFVHGHIPTCADICEIVVNTNGAEKCLSLLDTAGTSDYDRLRPLSFPQTDVFILAYCCVSPASFEGIRERCLPEVAHHCPEVPLYLVATKADLRTDKEVLETLATKKLKPISSEDGERYAREIGATFFETSALTGEGVRTLFETAAYIDDLQVENNVEGKEKKCRIS